MDIKFSFEISSYALAHSDMEEKVQYIEGLKDLVKKIQVAIQEDEEVHEDFEMRDVVIELSSKGKELDEEVCRRVGGRWEVQKKVSTCVVILRP